MNTSVIIRDLSSLGQLRTAIARFCEDNLEQVIQLESRIESRLDTLRSQESYFISQIEDAKNRLDQAKNALYACESDSYEDEDGNEITPDCSYEQEELYECRRDLADAEDTYRSFKKEIQNIELAIATYQLPKVKYKSFIQTEKENATHGLTQLINGAEDYLAASTLGGGDSIHDLNITDLIAKHDPTMILATAVGVAELMMMGAFSFLGISGSNVKVNNQNKNGVISTTYTDKDGDHVCSELKIARKESGNIGKILSVAIPASLESEKVGKHLVQNMESICRQNDCKEISGWSNSKNINFYKTLNYQTRHEIKDSGAEIFKPLNSDFQSNQESAKISFAADAGTEFSIQRKWHKREINPLKVITPDEVDDEKFWVQHDRDGLTRYIDLIEKYERCQQELNSGKTLDQIRSEDLMIANAHDVFHGRDPIRLVKSGDFFRIEENGRHRIAAAQTYYFQTGKIISLPAEVYEKDDQ